MIKTILAMTLLFSSLTAKSFNFSELRYSDALDSSTKLKGEIRFEINSLYIKYINSNKTILYKESDLIFKEGSAVLKIDEVQKQRISQYFKVVLLLYSNDEKKLNKKFDIVRNKNKITLSPKADLKNYIDKIVLTKLLGKLKQIELFLSNRDKIIIRLEDEIR